jgi:hypothetical protein
MLILLLLTVSLFSACEKTGNDYYPRDTEYIKYGISFGECLGYCQFDLTITESAIVFHKNGFDLEGLLPEISATEIIDAENWEELVYKIDFASFLSLDSIIGCPDCTDGGAEWVEIKNRDIIYKVTFEYLDEPDEFSAYIDILRNYLNAFRTNSGESV